MRKSYGEMARILGVEHCRGITPSGHYCQEQHNLNGSVTEGRVHFTDRRRTGPNTVAFLKLAAQALDPSINEEMVPWRRVYRLNLAVRELAVKVQTRIPARYLSADRAFVLAGVAGLTSDVPLRKRAYDWARRG